MPCEGQKETFQILFTSDVHAAFRNYNYPAGKETRNTGINKLATWIRREREAFPGTTFVLDAGDILQGNGTSVLLTREAGRFKPFPLLAAYDAIGYDAVIAGNHEFNYGIPAMLQAFEGYRGKKLCANVFGPNGEHLPGFVPYTVHTLACGLRVAFIGVVTPNIEKWDKRNIADQGWHAVNAAKQTRRVIDELKAGDLADVFVLLGHMAENNELDTPGSGAIDVIRMNLELAVFLGSHSHLLKGERENQIVLCGTTKFVENFNAANSLGQVFITATYENGRWQVKNKVGSYETADVKTDVMVLSKEDELSVPNDPVVDDTTKDAHAFLRHYMETTVIGKLQGGPMVPEPAIKGTNELALGPTPLNQFVGNVLRHFSGAPIAAVSPNDWSAGCEPGDITVGDVARMYVYENNTLCTVILTGAQLLKWLEWSYSFYGKTQQIGQEVVLDTGPAVDLATDLTIPYETRRICWMDHFTGLDYEIDLTQPVGKRVRILSLEGGAPFETQARYLVAVNDYRTTTQLTVNVQDGIFPPGEETAMLDRAEITTARGATNILEMIAEYIDEQPQKIITNACKHNWGFVNLNWDEAYRARAIEAVNTDRLVYDHRMPITKAQVDALT